MRQSASPAPPIAGRMRVVSRFARSEFQKKPTTAKAQTSCIAMMPTVPRPIAPEAMPRYGATPASPGPITISVSIDVMRKLAAVGDR